MAQFTVNVKVDPPKKAGFVGAAIEVADGQHGTLYLGPFEDGDIIRSLHISGRPVGTGTIELNLAYSPNNVQPIDSSPKLIRGSPLADQLIGAYNMTEIPLNREVNQALRFILVYFDLAGWTTT